MAVFKDIIDDVSANKSEKIDNQCDYIKLNYPESDDECLVADPLADTDFRNKKLIKL